MDEPIAIIIYFFEKKMEAGFKIIFTNEVHLVFYFYYLILNKDEK